MRGVRHLSDLCVEGCHWIQVIRTVRHLRDLCVDGPWDVTGFKLSSIRRIRYLAARMPTEARGEAQMIDM